MVVELEGIVIDEVALTLVKEPSRGRDYLTALR